MSKKIKARYIFKHDGVYSIVKGYIVNDKKTNKYFLYGVNNLSFLDRETKLFFIENYVESLEGIKDRIPDFVDCIIYSDAKIGDNSLVCNVNRRESVHLTLEPFVMEKVKEVLSDKVKTFNNTFTSEHKKDNLGVIQPNMSSVISEIILNYIYKEKIND